jgi:hypothetical protein
MEYHHLAGRANSSLTVTIDANMHRVLNDMQHDWPENTLRNQDGDPLIALAATLRGCIDMLMYVIHEVLSAIPVLLELLSEHLSKTHGRRWWETPEFAEWPSAVRRIVPAP